MGWSSFFLWKFNLTPYDVMHVHYTCSFSISGGVLFFTLISFFNLLFSSLLFSLIFFANLGLFPPSLLSESRVIGSLIIPVQSLGRVFFVTSRWGLIFLVFGVSKRFRVAFFSFFPLLTFLPIQSFYFLFFPSGKTIFFAPCYTISISRPVLNLCRAATLY